MPEGAASMVPVRRHICCGNVHHFPCAYANPLRQHGVQGAFILTALCQDESTQAALGPMQSGAQGTALRACGAAASDDVFLQAVPDFSTALGVQLHTAGVQRALKDATGPVAVEFAVRRGVGVRNINVLAIFIAQGKADHSAAATLTGSVLPAFDEVGAQPRKKEGCLFAVVHDGGCALVLALRDELGKKLLHGVFGIVHFTAACAGKGAEHGPVAAVKHGGGVQHGRIRGMASATAVAGGVVFSEVHGGGGWFCEYWNNRA